MEISRTRMKHFVFLFFLLMATVYGICTLLQDRGGERTAKERRFWVLGKYGDFFFVTEINDSTFLDCPTWNKAAEQPPPISRAEAEGLALAYAQTLASKKYLPLQIEILDSQLSGGEPEFNYTAYWRVGLGNNEKRERYVDLVVTMNGEVVKPKVTTD